MPRQVAHFLPEVFDGVRHQGVEGGQQLGLGAGQGGRSGAQQLDELLVRVVHLRVVQRELGAPGKGGRGAHGAIWRHQKPAG